MPNFSGNTISTSSQGINLSLTRMVAEGGQGQIYETSDPNYLAKIFKNNIAPDWLLRCKDRLLGAQLWKYDPALESLPRDIFVISGQLGHVSLRATGVTLANLIESGSYIVNQIPLAERFQLGIAVATGVRFLHQQGIIHADLCEPNIIIDRHGNTARIIDIDGLGIANSLTPLVVRAQGAIAPEILVKRQSFPDQISELWSLATILHKLLVGGPPFPHPVRGNQIWDKSNPVHYPVRDDQAQQLKLIGNSLRNNFERVFGFLRLGFLNDDRRNRLTAIQWEVSLRQAYSNIKNCSHCGRAFVPLLNTSRCALCT